MARFIVDNKLYDTNTAEKICTGYLKRELYSKFLGSTLTTNCRATLYKSKKGTWFFTYKIDSFGCNYMLLPTEKEALEFIQRFDYENYCKRYGPLEEG